MAIDIRYIRQVEALARHGNFARAARELNMSQPGLSRAIKTLENTLDVTLFDRNQREITPTVYGQHILKFGKPLLRDSERLEADLKLLKEGAGGELKIGAGPIPAEIFLGRALGAISKKHPKLKVRVIVERPATLHRLLQQRSVDVLLADIRVVEDKNGLDITTLPGYPICYVCRKSHPCLERDQLTLKDIFDYPIATPWIPEVIYETVAQRIGISKAEFVRFKNGLIECSYFKLLIDTVLNSDAVGCGLEPIFSREIREKNMVLLPITCPGLNSQYEIVTLENYTLSPAIQIFRQTIMDVLFDKGSPAG